MPALMVEPGMGERREAECLCGNGHRLLDADFLARDHPKPPVHGVSCARRRATELRRFVLVDPGESANKNAAWEFAKFVTCTVEGANNVFKTAGFLPSYKPAWDDKAYDEPVEFFGGQPVYRLWLDIAGGVPGNVVSPTTNKRTTSSARSSPKSKRGQRPGASSQGCRGGGC